jgi:hypothetical protein
MLWRRQSLVQSTPVARCPSLCASQGRGTGWASHCGQRQACVWLAVVHVGVRIGGLLALLFLPWSVATPRSFRTHPHTTPTHSHTLTPTHTHTCTHQHPHTHPSPDIRAHRDTHKHAHKLSVSQSRIVRVCGGTTCSCLAAACPRASLLPACGSHGRLPIVFPSSPVFPPVRSSVGQVPVELRQRGELPGHVDAGWARPLVSCCSSLCVQSNATERPLPA